MNQVITERMNRQIAEMTALLLWENGAVKINSDKPFKLASGNYSPIYINCRQVISDPVFMQLFVAFAASIGKWNQMTFEMVAGGETAGIPFAGYIAHALNLQMLYVRKKAKSYGIASKVEGGSPAGKNVILIEDLITDGGSKIGFIDALRAGGGEVSHTLVLFDRNQGGQETLAKLGVSLFSVTDLSTTLKVAEDNEIISKSNLSSVKNYLEDPIGWHGERSLTFTE